MIYVCKLDMQKELGRYSDIISEISPKRRKIINQYSNISDRVVHAYSELIIKYMVVKEMRFKDSDFEISYQKGGKPYLASIDRVHFNVSHTGNVIVSQICNNPVGIDIEKLMEPDWATIDFFCLEDETEYILASETNEERVRKYFEIWTAKETVLKLLGYGLYEDLLHVHVISRPGDVKKVEYKGNFFWIWQSYKDGYILSTSQHEKVTLLDPNVLL